MSTNSFKLNLGAVPTPLNVVQYIVYLLLKSYEEIKETKSSLRGLSVLDPAVGDGRFLITFISHFRKIAEKVGWDENLYCYGVDIDSNTIKNAHNNIKEAEDIESVSISLKVGNALLGYISTPAEWKKSSTKQSLNEKLISSLKLKKSDNRISKLAFHWFYEWPDVISNGGFNIILGNPPYGINYLPDEKLLFQKLYQALDPEVESYILFIERAIDLLCEGGLLGFIIPSNLLSNYRYQKIRQFLLDTVKIHKIINLDNKIFSGVHVETCILILQKISNQKERDNNEIQFENTKNPLKPPYRPFLKKSNVQYQILINPYRLLLPKLNNSIVSILEKIEDNCNLLGKIVSISRGIELGYHSEYTSDQKIDSDYVPLVAGRSIRKYRLNSNIRYIRFDYENKSIFKDYKKYHKPKLMLRRIGHELIAAYDPNEYFCVCDVYMITLRRDFSLSKLFYLEALLNSKLMSYYLIQKFSSVKQIFPKIPIMYLKNLPIKIPLNLTKVQNLVHALHKLPWDISKTSNDHLIKLDDIDQEIYKIYRIEEDEQEKISKSFNSNMI